MHFRTFVFILLFITTITGCGTSGRKGEPQATPSPAYRDRSVFQGLASWYGKKFHGRKTASGERFNMHAFTAAHRTLPFGTRVEVKNLDTGKVVTVRINDRGPFAGNRIIDVSYAAAKKLGLITSGVAKVEVRRVGS